MNPTYPVNTINPDPMKVLSTPEAPTCAHEQVNAKGDCVACGVFVTAMPHLHRAEAPAPVTWTASPRPGRKRHRQNDLGRIERKAMELAHKDGEISPRALRALGVKNPERVLCRLSADGYLVRVHRGVYKVPQPGRVVLEQAREKRRHVIRKETISPEALPCRGIKKGSYLSIDKQPILPGDTVLFRKEGKRSRVGVLVEGDAAGHVTLLVGLGVYEKLEGEPGDFVRVAGFFSRRTKSAARARDANTPHEKAPPPDAVFWTPETKKASS